MKVEISPELLRDLQERCRFHSRTSQELDLGAPHTLRSFEAGLRSLAAIAMRVNREIRSQQDKDWPPCNEEDLGRNIT